MYYVGLCSYSMDIVAQDWPASTLDEHELKDFGCYVKATNGYPLIPNNQVTTANIPKPKSKISVGFLPSVGTSS